MAAVRVPLSVLPVQPAAVRLREPLVLPRHALPPARPHPAAAERVAAVAVAESML